MPQVRSYPQTTVVQAADAILLDRVGTGTVWIDGADFDRSAGLGVYNVKWYGAVGDGVTDDTAAIQATLDAGGVGSVVYFPPGSYLLSATLTGHLNQSLVGAGPNQSILSRSTAYGSTFHYANLGAATITGLWFSHGNVPANTSTPLTGRATDGSAHVRIDSGQGWTISNCWFWRLPYNVDVGTSANCLIDNCKFLGIWDPLTANCQEGLANIAIGSSGYAQLMTVRDCYVAGVPSVARSTTWTASDGTVTATVANNCGAMNGISISQCEGFELLGGYMGGNSACNVFVTLTGAATAAAFKIKGVFFDGAGLQSAMIQVTTVTDGALLNGLVVEGCNFNGESISYQAILATNASGTRLNPALTNFSIVGNTSQATVGSFCTLFDARGGVFGQNSIAAYNARNVSAGADTNFCCALWGDATYATAINADGNTIGGSINGSAPTSFCYQGIVGAHIVEKGTVWNGVGPSGTLGGKCDQKFVTVTNSYTMTGSEDVIRVAASAALTITPNANPAYGQTVTIKDAGGNSAVNNISFIGTVDSSVNLAISTNFASRTLMFNSAGWDVIGGYK